MSDERDPRQNPETGDLLVYSGCDVEVMGTEPIDKRPFVHWLCGIVPSATPLEHWRELMENAKLP